MPSAAVPFPWPGAGRCAGTSVPSDCAAARARFDLKDAWLLAQSPFWAPLAAALRKRYGWRIVYDCLDAHAEFSTNRPRILAEAEREIASAADLVVATSEALRRKMAPW